MSTGYDRNGRIIRKVVISYRLEGDPEDTERTWTLKHGGAGEVINGLIWNGELMKKVAYLENGECRVPEKSPGKGEWKTYIEESRDNELGLLRLLLRRLLRLFRPSPRFQALSADSGGGDCIWVHEVNCTWWEYCTDSPG